MNVSRVAMVPTTAELNLLSILWRLGPSTVRQVHDYICETQKVGYTTVLKMFQVMHDKGLVNRDETNRAHIYVATDSEQQMQNNLVNDLVSKAFGGSKYELVVRALGESTSREELHEIRSLIDSLDHS